MASMLLRSLLITVCLVAIANIAAAGCAKEIFNCRDKEKDLCAARQCSTGLVCRVDNCGGCTAKCEPPGTVHIMSVPSRPAAGQSKPTDQKVTAEAGCACPKIMLPVCGADGKKYNNKCLAECAKTKVIEQRPDSSGKCPPGASSTPKLLTDQPSGPKGFVCRCARMYKPVCGTDGKFYDNECLAICEGVKVSEAQPDVSAKRCPASNATATGAGQPAKPEAAKPQQQPACKCPKILKRVCGSDGKVYDNECIAKCAGVTVTGQQPDQCKASSQGAGQPQRACACPYILFPVCGTDGKVYSNECLAKCAGVASTGKRPGSDNKCS